MLVVGVSDNRLLYVCGLHVGWSVCVCVVGMSAYTANTTPSAGSACVVNAHDQSFAAHPLSVQFAAGET